MRLSERSDLPFIGAREGGERVASRAEGTEGDETNRQQPRGAAFVFNIHYSKTFQLPSDLSYTRSAWQKFRHRLGSFPQPAARRVMTRRGMARRAAEEERAWMSLLFSCSYKWERTSLIKRSNSL